MFFSTLFALLAFTSAASSAATAQVCNAQQRINYAKMVPYAYAQPGVIAVKEAFEQIPFGVPDLNGPCTTVM